MYVRKVKGQNKIYAIKVTAVEAMIAKRLGVGIEQYVKAYVDRVAKQRKWKWYFERKTK